jgi:hypothetical protein
MGSKSPEPVTKQVTIDRKHEQELVKDLGLFAIKTAITLCSGGFIVILTFLGSTLENSAVNVDIAQLKIALFFLLTGIVFSAIAVFVSYLIAQTRLGNGGLNSLDRKGGPWFIIVQSFPLITAFILFACGASFAIMSFGAG